MFSSLPVCCHSSGLHDCDSSEYVAPDQYAANLKSIFETLKPAASAVVFVTTTPYDMPLTHGEPPFPAGKERRGEERRGELILYLYLDNITTISCTMMLIGVFCFCAENNISCTHTPTYSHAHALTHSCTHLQVSTWPVCSSTIRSHVPWHKRSVALYILQHPLKPVDISVGSRWQPLQSVDLSVDLSVDW
jgi:hypothetical protein